MAEVAENDMLDPEAGRVVGEDKGNPIPGGVAGGWGERRSA